MNTKITSWHSAARVCWLIPLTWLTMESQMALAQESCCCDSKQSTFQDTSATPESDIQSQITQIQAHLADLQSYLQNLQEANYSSDVSSGRQDYLELINGQLLALRQSWEQLQASMAVEDTSNIVQQPLDDVSMENQAIAEETPANDALEFTVRDADITADDTEISQNDDVLAANIDDIGDVALQNVEPGEDEIAAIDPTDSDSIVTLANAGDSQDIPDTILDETDSDNSGNVNDDDDGDDDDDAITADDDSQPV